MRPPMQLWQERGSRGVFIDAHISTAAFGTNRECVSVIMEDLGIELDDDAEYDPDTNNRIIEYRFSPSYSGFLEAVMRAAFTFGQWCVVFQAGTTVVFDADFVNNPIVPFNYATDWKAIESEIFAEDDAYVDAHTDNALWWKSFSASLEENELKVCTAAMAELARHPYPCSGRPSSACSSEFARVAKEPYEEWQYAVFARFRTDCTIQNLVPIYRVNEAMQPGAKVVDGKLAFEEIAPETARFFRRADCLAPRIIHVFQTDDL